MVVAATPNQPTNTCYGMFLCESQRSSEMLLSLHPPGRDTGNPHASVRVMGSEPRGIFISNCRPSVKIPLAPVCDVLSRYHVFVYTIDKLRDAASCQTNSGWLVEEESNRGACFCSWSWNGQTYRFWVERVYNCWSFDTTRWPTEANVSTVFNARTRCLFYILLHG